MQIFQWLLKLAHEQVSSPPNQNDNKAVSKDITSSRTGSKPRRRTESWNSKKFVPFRFLCRKHIAKACFYSTINLRRVSSFDKRRMNQMIRSMKTRKQEEHCRELGISQKVDPNTNKVLPVTEAAAADSFRTTNPKDEKKEKSKWDNKVKTLSRMKELIRWAAAAKSEKGHKSISRKVSQFRNQGSLKLKQAPEDDKQINETPKMSFRWETESCSTISSIHSARKKDVKRAVSLSSTPVHGIDRSTTKRGNWITSDSEFVVLEL